MKRPCTATAYAIRLSTLTVLSKLRLWQQGAISFKSELQNNLQAALEAHQTLLMQSATSYQPPARAISEGWEALGDALMAVSSGHLEAVQFAYEQGVNWMDKYVSDQRGPQSHVGKAWTPGICDLHMKIAHCFHTLQNTDEAIRHLSEATKLKACLPSRANGGLFEMESMLLTSELNPTIQNTSGGADAKDAMTIMSQQYERIVNACVSSEPLPPHLLKHFMRAAVRYVVLLVESGNHSRLSELATHIIRGEVIWSRVQKLSKYFATDSSGGLSQSDRQCLDAKVTLGEGGYILESIREDSNVAVGQDNSVCVRHLIERLIRKVTMYWAGTAFMNDAHTRTTEASAYLYHRELQTLLQSEYTDQFCLTQTDNGKTPSLDSGAFVLWVDPPHQLRQKTAGGPLGAGSPREMVFVCPTSESARVTPATPSRPPKTAASLSAKRRVSVCTAQVSSSAVDAALASVKRVAVAYKKFAITGDPALERDAVEGYGELIKFIRGEMATNHMMESLKPLDPPTLSQKVLDGLRGIFEARYGYRAEGKEEVQLVEWVAAVLGQSEVAS
ncbi:hypothetical protein HK405_006152 [Cladochytrium tenue]|nr:hypothetical protein HK405_006152 [Cladochytrium tenue]